MKNLVIALSLFSALGAVAQTKSDKTTKIVATKEMSDPRITIETAAQKNVNDLIAFTPVTTQIQSALKELFIYKQSMMKEVASLSQERKDVVTQGIEYKLSVLLEPATFAKLKSNKDLYSSLIN